MQFSVDFELRIESKQKPLVAVLDAVVSNTDWVLIKEFKTGAVRADHQDQVHFYAEMYEEEFGRPADKLVIEYLSSGNVDIRPDPSRGIEIVSEMLLRKGLFDDKVSRGFSPPANPSLENCAYCQFRPICTGYLDSGIRVSRLRDLAVAGRITGIGRAGESYLFEVTSGDISNGPYTLLLPKESTQKFEQGDVLALDGVEKDFRSNTLRAAWNSSIWAFE